MYLEHNGRRYEVGKRIANAATYRLYLCKEVITDTECLLQIAADTHDSGGLDRAAYILRTLSETAEEFEAEYAKSNPDRKLSYERLFPRLVDSFVTDEDQAWRRVNILTINEVDDVTKLVPLSNLRSKDRLRISLTSSAWVLGRLLKLLGFVHDEGIAVRSLGGNNILLEPSQHFALVFDWSNALTCDGQPSSKARRGEIAQVTSSVFTAIGGNVATGEYPYVNDAADDRYVEYLRVLMNRPPSNALKAHEKFYGLVEDLWGREFQPFTTMPL